MSRVIFASADTVPSHTVARATSLIGKALAARCRFSTDRSTSAGDPMKGADPTQSELMKEECILVDNQDNVLGKASKKECIHI